MPFNLMPGERVVFQTENIEPGLGQDALIVTSRRLVVQRSGWGESSTTYLPLDKLDSLGHSRTRTPFPTRRFIFGLLLGVIPGIIILLFWLFRGRDEIIVFGTASGQISFMSRTLFSRNEIGSLLDVVESARQESAREALPAAAAPPRIELRD